MDEVCVPVAVAVPVPSYAVAVAPQVATKVPREALIGQVVDGKMPVSKSTSGAGDFFLTFFLVAIGIVVGVIAVAGVHDLLVAYGCSIKRYFAGLWTQFYDLSFGDE